MGKETIPIYELLAQKYGFTVQQIEVPHPGNEQESQWLTIRRAKPEYVVLRGWGVMNPVAIKTAQKVGAQEKFGHRTLSGDEVRWGFEHLKLDPARVEALGAKNLFHSINVTWDNHEGDGYVTLQQWDGKKWNVVSDWIAPDWALLRPIIEKSANDYAAEHKIPLRTAEDAERVDTKPFVANK
jgi:branched-chain amino acid transport system substrate-binding protein